MHRGEMPRHNVSQRTYRFDIQRLLSYIYRVTLKCNCKRAVC
jgi:hypothetical protein